MARTIAWTVWAPCLSSTRARRRRGSSLSQDTRASTSVSTWGASPAAARVSPRATSISSVRRTVTDWPSTASSRLRSPRSMPATRERLPEGSTTTGSPTRTVPEAIRPA